MMKRRNFVKCVNLVAGTITLPGCINSQPGSVDQSPTPQTPTPSIETSYAGPATNCPKDVRAFNPSWYATSGGYLDGWELSLNKEVYEYGDELIARLVNSTNEDRSIGDKGNIDIQYNNDGWNTIFGKPVGEEQPDPLILIEVEPGGEIEWKLTLNEDSLSELDVAAPFTLRLCQKLKSGEYRFVYWDLMDSDDAIGVRFTIEGI